eukprot:SAG22_NODE_1490_length_4307_cov_6.140684_2_plen_91_part_00
MAAEHYNSLAMELKDTHLVMNLAHVCPREHRGSPESEGEDSTRHPGTQPFLPLKCAAAFRMGRTHWWYAPCPTCRHLFGECEIKTLYPTS